MDSRDGRMIARHGVVLLLLAGAVWSVFGQAGGFEFLAWDDGRYVTGNPFLRQGLTWDGVKWAFTAAGPPLNTFWQPISWLSLILDLELYGMTPAGFHLTSVFLHMLNSMLLYGALYSMTASLPRSAVVAALFALHPCHVEPVVWISERKELLSTAFALLSLWSYAAWARRRRLRDYVLSAALLALGIMSKAMIVTLPFVLLLLDGWPLRRIRFGEASPSGGHAGRLLLEKVPLFAIAAAGASITFVVQGEGLKSIVPLGLRAANALVSYARYLGMAVWPRDLSPMYPHPYLPELGEDPWTAWQIAAAGALLVAISAAVYWSRRGYAVVGWLWFLGTLLPVIGLIQFSTFAMADRYTYFPLTGLFIAAVWGIGELMERRAQSWPAARRAVAAAAVVALVACGIASRTQAGYWRDSETLFRRALQINPDNPPMLGNLGIELRERGEVDAAIELYRHALRINPGYAEIYYNLGNALVAKSDLSGAIDAYRRALELKPTFVRTRVNLAAALAIRGSPGEAADHYRAAIREGFGGVDVHRTLAHVLAQTGDFEEAILHYQEALRIDPNDSASAQGLARARGRLEASTLPE